ncbi:hypothetical protein DSO57_1031051 [Entomophthora muscae]|uniref:Uncharacterized protein n=1 Tax=Entomophthora muscae TaxID=34485 RepID=A0ACC2SDE5_9FUNG|nr:hypothetical protein DSO57_1031051 [Entomophthora muscae]
MYGADAAMRDSDIINCLEKEAQTIILSCLSEDCWTFTNIYRALTEEFSIQEALLSCKMNFSDTKLKAGVKTEGLTSQQGSKQAGL